MLEGWFFQPGEVSLEEYIREIWLAEQNAPQDAIEISPDYMHLYHIVNWWQHWKDPKMLLAFFKDLKESYESFVRSIEQIYYICDEASIQAALEKTTFEYIKKYRDKFDMKLLK